MAYPQPNAEGCDRCRNLRQRVANRQETQRALLRQRMGERRAQGLFGAWRRRDRSSISVMDAFKGEIGPRAFRLPTLWGIRSKVNGFRVNPKPFRCESEQHSGLKMNTDPWEGESLVGQRNGVGLGAEWRSAWRGMVPQGEPARGTVDAGQLSAVKLQQRRTGAGRRWSMRKTKEL